MKDSKPKGLLRDGQKQGTATKNRGATPPLPAANEDGQRSNGRAEDRPPVPCCRTAAKQSRGDELGRRGADCGRSRQRWGDDGPRQRDGGAGGAATDPRRADLSRPRPRGRRIRDGRTRWRADPARTDPQRRAWRRTSMGGAENGRTACWTGGHLQQRDPRPADGWTGGGRRRGRRRRCCRNGRRWKGLLLLLLRRKGEKKWIWGLRRCWPPGADRRSQGQRAEIWVVSGIQETWSCDTMSRLGEEEESETISYIGEAQRAIYST